MCSAVFGRQPVYAVRSVAHFSPLRSCLFFCFPPCSSPHVRQTALPHRATVNRKTPSSKQFAMFVSTLALSRYIKSSEHGKVFVLKYHYLSISCFMFLLSSAQWGDTVIERLVCSAIRIFREMLAASFIGFS